MLKIKKEENSKKELVIKKISSGKILKIDAANNTAKCHQQIIELIYSI